MIPRFCFILAVSCAAASCAVKSIPTELLPNHPANPHAVETPFKPPPNHFTSDVSLPTSQAPAPSTNHTQHDNSSKHDLNHQEDSETKTGHESQTPTRPAGKQIEHRHHKHGESHK